ncbi:MAG TPA: efflux RND transporter periplasmic adaptor subunit [Burkholderiaceae bacterium]|nr:efflux RND transporter periplasmic adaptor subunit [Burkholderiaceae bacterium]
MTRGKTAWWIGGAVALLAAAGVAALVIVKQGQAKVGKKDGDGKPAVTLEFTPREVVAPTLASMPTQLEFSGPLVAPQTAVVRAKASGTLLTLAVAEGARVKAGQLLATIDAAEMTSRLAERAAMVESARAAVAQAERTHASNQRLADQQFISPIALDQSRSALDAARAQERAALAQQDVLRVVSRDTRIVAPIAGIVARRQAVAGEKVSAEQPVLTIVDLARLELAGSVGTHEVGQLAPGAAVQVKVEGVEQAVLGKIARIAPAAEAGTRSIGVTIELPNPQEALRAGQYALARVELADPQQRLTVPATAVGNNAGQDHVWLIENGTLARRAVTLGRRDAREGRVEVLAGVTPGSQVLAARFDNLREGGKAVVVATKSSAVASAAASAPVSK